MKQVFNFSAGPATLPKAVLKKAQDDLLNYQNTGMSVMEMSHRSQAYESIHNEAINLFKELMHVPDTYEVLFIQGGASLQFAMIPMNFANGKKAYYVDAGLWGIAAYKDGVKVLGDNAILHASSKDQNYAVLPTVNDVPDDAAYLHMTSNNTTEGTTVYKFPDNKKVPLIVDMSSNIFSVDYDINDFDMVYAGAQKNLGAAGVTVVIVKKSLLDSITRTDLPNMLDYRTYAAKNSMFNTPPTYSIYIVGLVLKWVKDMGGVSAMETSAKEKSKLLYDTLDNSKLFKATVNDDTRSLNNITFKTDSDELNALFIKEATAANLLNLKGHRLVGGMRASIYNAMTLEGVEALVEFINQFEEKHGGQVNV